MENRFCSNCGNNVPSGASFCPKCGQSVVPVPVVTKTTPAATPPPRTAASARTTAPAAAPPHAAPRNSKSWIWVPVAMVGLIVILWAVLAGMPFGGSDEPLRPARPAADVIAERPAAQNTATIVETTPPDAMPPLVPTTSTPAATATAGTMLPPMTSAAPPTTPQPVPTPVQTPAPAPVRQTPTTQTPTPTPTPRPVQQTPAPTPTPRPATPAPAPAQREREEISESEAMGLLRNYIGTRDQYGSSVDCVSVGSEGYRNRGYTLYARDRCDGHTFGRWRVDSVTREVFREKTPGRFLRP